MTESGIPSYSGNESSIIRRFLTSVFLTVLYTCLSVDIRTCSTSPVGGLGRGNEDASIHRRSLQNFVPSDPHEKCFDTTCNRVTHYCDEVIRSCASCEDDCHPGRIEGDEQTTQECLKKCDWYYYINSLKSNLHSTLETTVSSASLSEHVGSKLTDYQLFAIVLAVVTVCFTIIIVIIIGVFCCYFKKLSPKLAVVRQETAQQPTPIYKPQTLRPYSSTDSKRKQNGDTNIKLLADNYEDSVNNGTVQQESIHNNISYTPSSISLASTSQVHNCCNKAYAAQDHRNGSSFRQSPTDSSTQQLVK